MELQFERNFFLLNFRKIPKNQPEFLFDQFLTSEPQLQIMKITLFDAHSKMEVITTRSS